MTEHCCQHFLQMNSISEKKSCKMEKLLNSESEDGVNMDYVKSVFVEMNELRKERCFCDVIIECDDGRRFEGHRVVLASSSPYFRAMFTHNMQESQQKLIKIRQVESRVMEELLNFAYSGKTLKFASKDQDFIETLLVASNMLQFQQVEDSCIEYLSEHITVKSYDKLRVLAQLHPQMALKKAVDAFIVRNFTKIMNTPAFLKFDVEELEIYFDDTNLNVHTEVQVFDALFKWVNHDKNERTQHIKVLLSKIKLALLPKYFLDHIIKQELLKSEDFSRMFKKACEYREHPERRCLLRNKMTIPRQYTNGFIYVIGGYDRVEERFLNTVDCYDINEGMWLNVAPMATARIRHGVTVLDGMIYAVGGQCDDDVSVRTVERFDPISNKWADVSPMNECKGQLAVAVCDGKIYCIGGTDDLLKVSLNCVECYDPVTNSWSKKASMPTARGALGAATLNGKIYAVGGGDFHVALDTVEVYDPKHDYWSSAPSMNFARGCLGLTCVNDTLYAFGGAHMHNGMMTYLEESIECFDPKMNRWMVISGTEISCWGVGICSVVSGNSEQSNQSDLFIVGGIYEFTERDKMLKVTITDRQIFCTPFPNSRDLICRVHTGAVALSLPPG